MKDEQPTLVIDRGNTLWKWGVFQEGQWLDYGASNRLTKILEQPLKVETILFGSVGKCTEDDLELLRKSGGIIVERPDPQNLPFICHYETYETLGLDRLCGVLAGQIMYPGADLLIIDAGSCITTDLFIDGAYLGGSISPGIQMRLNAMHQHTANLPLIQRDEWKEVVGRISSYGSSSRDCLISGGCMGAIYEIEALVQRYLNHYPGLRVLLTGGDANIFESRLKNSIFAHPQLILRGLYELYKL